MRKPRIFDQEGRFLGNVGAADEHSIGAAAFEFFNPSIVQQEYEAIGKERPTYTQVWGMALDDAVSASVEAKQDIQEGLRKAATAGVTLGALVVIGIVGMALIVYSPQIKRISGKSARRKE